MSGNRQDGFSLLELLAFIVIVGIALSGTILAFGSATRHSSDPLVRKQAMIVAESMLDEIQTMPFTWCDPDDDRFAVAKSVGECLTTPEVIGPEGGESRHGPSWFDNINDYHGFSMTGIQDVFSVNHANLSGYSVSVTVNESGTDFGLPNEDALRIDVRVWSGNVDMVLTGFRMRHSPNA